MNKIVNILIGLCLLFITIVPTHAATIIEVEPNETDLTPQKITPTFISGSSNTIIDASLGTTTDTDIYAIAFKDYSATISLTLHDSYSPSGGYYTVDAKFSYKIGRYGTYSSTYDTQTTGISNPYGDTLFVKVVSYYTSGTVTGTYDLYIDATGTYIPGGSSGSVITLTYSTSPESVSATGSGYTTGYNSSSSELDYFTFELDSFYKYSIVISLTDEYNSPSSGYTGDAEFDYSINNGASWSGGYDSQCSSFIVTGPLIIKIRVYPYNYGSSYVGSYRLNANVTRTVVNQVDINEPLLVENLNIYPNPSNGNFTVELGDAISGKGSLSITSLTGAVVYSEEVELSGKIAVSCTIPTGSYLLEVKTDEARYINRLIIK